jgi:hypothetical protein
MPFEGRSGRETARFLTWELVHFTIEKRFHLVSNEPQKINKSAS